MIIILWTKDFLLIKMSWNINSGVFCATANIWSALMLFIHWAQLLAHIALVNVYSVWYILFYSLCVVSFFWFHFFFAWISDVREMEFKLSQIHIQHLYFKNWRKTEVHIELKKNVCVWLFIRCSEYYDEKMKTYFRKQYGCLALILLRSHN